MSTVQATLDVYKQLSELPQYTGADIAVHDGVLGARTASNKLTARCHDQLDARFAGRQDAHQAVSALHCRHRHDRARPLAANDRGLWR